MAEQQGRSSGKGTHRRSLTRLQRRAPASIQVGPPADWKVAIPLLSPLVLSPASPNQKLGDDRKVEVKSREEPSRPERQFPDNERPSFKKWQHPAAPFYYEPAPPLVGSFVPHCR